MSNCSNCGKPVEGKSEICPNCGPKGGFGSTKTFGLGHPAILIFLIVLCCGMAIVLLPIFASARSASKRVAMLSQAKQVAMSVALYSADHDDKFPPMESSQDVANQISKYSLDNFKPQSIHDFAASCTWNKAVGGISEMAFESLGDIWLFYSEQESRTETRAMAFLDTHVTSANQFVFDRAMATKAKFVDPKGQKPTVFEPDK